MDSQFLFFKKGICAIIKSQRIVSPHLLQRGPTLNCQHFPGACFLVFFCFFRYMSYGHREGMGTLEYWPCLPRQRSRALRPLAASITVFIVPGVCMTWPIWLTLVQLSKTTNFIFASPRIKCDLLARDLARGNHQSPWSKTSYSFKSFTSSRSFKTGLKL